MIKILKWLRPGLRIKRWIVVIFLGVLWAVVAVLGMIHWLLGQDNMPGATSQSGRLIAGIVLAYMCAAFCLITGVYRLIKSMWAMMDRRVAGGRGLVDFAYKQAVLRQGPRVVAIGGGTGLSVVLAGLRDLSSYTTAIVSMADDGGSSGRLRKELGLQPPGDLRKCLIALADEEQRMAELLDYRFPEHELGGHNFGNLFLTVLARIRGDFGAAVREANQILSVQGQVLPSTLEKIFLVAEHEDGSKTTGQALIAKTEKRIKRLELKPRPEPVAPDIVKAVEEADLIVLGPGSLYTSVLPNLLIDGLCLALAKSKARKVFVANIMTYEGETRGYDLPDFLEAIDKHTHPYHVYNTVLVNNGPYDPALRRKDGDDGDTWIIDERPARRVKYGLEEFRKRPFRVVESDVVNPAYPIRHDTRKLALALIELLKEA